MTSFLYRIPAGIPGDVNRAHIAHVEPVSLTPVGTTGAPTTYGVPVAIDGTTGNARMISASDTAIYGILVRPFPSQQVPNQVSGQLYQDLMGAGVPPGKGGGDVLRRGYITVLLSGSAAATKNGAVFVWTAAASGTHITGGFEAAATSGSTLAIPATFMGAADANGNVEIAYNT